MFRGEVAADLLTIFLVAVVDHDLAAIALGGGHLGRRRIVRHDDRCRNTQQTGGQRDGLSVIPRGKRDDARAPLILIEFRQSIECAAKLECSRSLKVLAFEKHLRAELSIDRAGGHDGGSVSMTLDSIRGRNHVLEVGEAAGRSLAKHTQSHYQGQGIVVPSRPAAARA